MAGARVIGMAVGDDGAIHPAAHGVDVEISRRAIEAPWRRAEKVFGADHAGNMRFFGLTSKLSGDRAPKLRDLRLEITKHTAGMRLFR